MGRSPVYRAPKGVSDAGPEYRRELDDGCGSGTEKKTGKNGTRAQVDNRITGRALTETGFYTNLQEDRPYGT